MCAGTERNNAEAKGKTTSLAQIVSTKTVRYSFWRESPRCSRCDILTLCCLCFKAVDRKRQGFNQETRWSDGEKASHAKPHVLNVS